MNDLTAEIPREERRWAAFAHLSALLELLFVIVATLQVTDGRPYRYPFNLRLVQ